MKKSELTEAVEKAKAETREAMQTMYEALNQGQRKKMAKDEKVKKLFDRHGMRMEDGE